MKTERRHELQHNKLAVVLDRYVEIVKPYSKAILGAVLAGLVVLGTYLYLANQTEAKTAQAWNDCWQALSGDSPKQMTAVVEKDSGTPAALWCQEILGDSQLREGIGGLFMQKAVGRAQINDALDNYLSVQQHVSAGPLHERATFGIAQAEEALGDLSKARDSYQLVLQKYPNGPYAAEAQRRLKQLSREPIESFYDWFKAVEPAQVSLGNPETKSTIDQKLLQTTPDLKLPSVTEPIKTPPPFSHPDEPAKPTAGAKPPGQGNGAPPPAKTEPPAKAESPAKSGPSATKPQPPAASESK